MALRAEVVDLVRLDLVDQVHQADPVGEVAVVQVQVGLAVEVVDPAAVQRRRAADQAVHLVALAEQQLGEVEPSWPVMPVMNARFMTADSSTRHIDDAERRAGDS